MYQELQAIHYNNQHIVWIPNGVDLATYHNVEDRQSLRAQMGIDSEKIILYTGRLSAPQKMLDFLIVAYAKLRVALPTKLYIIGDGPEKARLQRIIKKYTLENSIRLIPAVEAVAAFLQSADVFVMPSRFEGLSNAILEAMACGLPVVATRVAGNIDLIEDGVTGLLVEPNNAAQLAAALSYLIKNPERAREIGCRAHALIKERYNLDHIAEKYIALYKSLQ
jgi:glycosyltransferase involved in cell wall biosynthesis